MTPNGNDVSNKTCKGLNELSLDMKNTQFGLKMRNLWPFELD